MNHIDKYVPYGYRAGMNTDPLHFSPVPVAPRRDGWTDARQRAFIKHLADSASVEEAAAHVGMTTASARRLRRRPGAESFNMAWWHAMKHNISQLHDSLLDRCINGIAVPIVRRNEIIGERRVFNLGVALALLKRMEEQSVLYPSSLEPHEHAIVTQSAQFTSIPVNDNFLA